MKLLFTFIFKKYINRYKTNKQLNMTNNNQTICDRCGDANHTISYCDAAYKITGELLKCMLCSKFGHITQYCGENEDEDEE